MIDTDEMMERFRESPYERRYTRDCILWLAFKYGIPALVVGAVGVWWVL